MTVAFELRSPAVHDKVVEFILKRRPDLYNFIRKTNISIYYIQMKQRECVPSDSGLKCHEIIDAEQMEKLCKIIKEKSKPPITLCDDGIAVAVYTDRIEAFLNEVFIESSGLEDAVKHELSCCPRWVILPFFE